MTILHPALIMMIRLRLRARGRRMVRNLKSFRGMMFGALGLILILLFIGPAILTSFAGPRTDPAVVRAVGPLLLLAFVLLGFLTNSGERAVYFSPGEVEFLFPGPFSRRELLVYKIMLALVGVCLTALFLSIVFLRHMIHWYAGFTALTLALWFIHLLNMTLFLAAQVVAEKSFTRARRAVLYVAIGALALAIWQATSAGAGQGMAEMVEHLQQSRLMSAILLPFSVFVRLFTAERLAPDYLVWTAASLAICLAMAALVIRLDVNYLETSLDVSKRLYARIQSARRSGVMNLNKAGEVRRRLPNLPRWGGAGTVMRRQLANAIRNSRGLAVILVLLIAGASPMLMQGPRITPWPAFIGALIWLTIMLTLLIRFDFRSDIDQLDWLKMMPFRPLAVAAGEVTVPILIATVVQLALAAAAAYKTGTCEIVVLTVAVALPVNMLLFGLENLTFLLFPVRLMQVNPGDFQFFGRQLALFLLKGTVLLICGALAAGFGALVYWISGGNKAAAGVAGWVVLSAQALALLPAIAWVYGRFDVSLHMPE
jgi:hypothetical protein